MSKFIGMPDGTKVLVRSSDPNTLPEMTEAQAKLKAVEMLKKQKKPSDESTKEK